jgi:hypothetical protein
MIKMILGQLLTPDKIREASENLNQMLSKHELHAGEMKPLMVLQPSSGKILLNIITLKEVDGKVVYSRQLDSQEFSAETLAQLIAGNA